MKKFFRAILIAIIPILRAAGRDILVGVVDAALLPTKEGRRRLEQIPLPEARLGAPRERLRVPPQRTAEEAKHYRTLATVVFDISGPNPAVVEEFLVNYVLPSSKYYREMDTEIYSSRIEGFKE